jgi:Rps23 Pro-64 3,4-dihydroxylase Tpa1-like proline 4-hydroxylase
MTRAEYAAVIVERLNRDKDTLATEFRSPGRVRSFVVDDLLHEAAAREIYDAFPAPSAMMKRHSLRESKYFAAQIDEYNRLLGEILFAFQEPNVARMMEYITGIDQLLPDPQLYAGGVSMMVKGSFLNPHLDNSHDAKQKRYRVLNSLYYVTPGWRDDYGGNLELWDQGPGRAQRTIVSRFNRLVLMATDRSSWHSVSPVVHDSRRTCVSNYYFREQPLASGEYFHATSFRGRPDQPGRDLVLRADNALRTAILSLVNVPTKHIYKPRP